jgi:hypothetical protein
MTDQKKPFKVEFAPGCFDNFDGTQEELDELIAQITEMATNGELVEQGQLLSEEDWEELDDEVKLHLMETLGSLEEGSDIPPPPRNLH